jgi:hypothetical protein
MEGRVFGVAGVTSGDNKQRHGNTRETRLHLEYPAGAEKFARSKACIKYLTGWPSV